MRAGLCPLHALTRSRSPSSRFLPLVAVQRSVAVGSASRSAPFLRKMGVEERLAELGIVLPTPVQPKGNYCLATRCGNLLFLAGHIPQKDGRLITGKVGADMSVDDAYQAARIIAINILATLKVELGSLDKIKRITKITGFVACVESFSQQPSVINGASDLFVEVLGPKGVHARSAVGTNALPFGIPVEIEAIVEVEDN